MENHEAVASPDERAWEERLTDNLDSNHSETGIAASICVLIPAFGAADLLRNCLQSLAACLPANCVVYVLDDATPDHSVREACSAFEGDVLNLTYVRNEKNRGFVETCNWGAETYWRTGMDLLLLNSDTEVTPGFLEEMHSVLHAHERHAAVTPRSNNATIFSIPHDGDRLPPQESYAIWKEMKAQLPRFHVVPTAIGFCMLIRSEMIAEFGLFDKIYSPGYNEENDFICRVNRCGYSAVAANHAFVFHYESSSFGVRKKALDAARRQILCERYPEYDRKVADYLAFNVNPLEDFAELYSPHRPRILLDFNTLPAHPCGTSEFALNLLRELSPLSEGADYELCVGISSTHNFASEIRGYQAYDYRLQPRRVFDLVFKPSQIFTWREFRVMNRLAPRVAFALLDIIAVRCDYLSAAGRTILFERTAELSDQVFAISRFSQNDFNAMYNQQLAMQVIHLGSNFERGDRASAASNHVIVMGNHFAHKAVAETIALLQDEFSLIVFGSPKGPSHPNIRWLESGTITRRRLWEIFTSATAIVYPSHYEGYGLPVMDAIALNVPVLCRTTQVNREITAGTSADSLYFFSTTKEIPDLLRSAIGQSNKPLQAEFRTWKDCAREYHAAFQALLQREIDVPKLQERTAVLRLLESNGVSMV